MTEADLQPLVTRCPDCATQFKVSEAQLQVANGKVRCGSCLAVFEGVDNLVWDSDFDGEESADVTLDDLLDELKDEGTTQDLKASTGADSEPVADASAEVGSVEDADIQSAPQLESTLGQSNPHQDNSTEQGKTPETKSDSLLEPPVEDSEEEFDRELAANQIVLAAKASTAPSVDFTLEPIEVPLEDELLDLGSSYVGPDYASLKRTPDQHEEQQRRSRNRREAMAEMHAMAAQRESEEAAAPIDETQIADTPESVPAVAEADLQAASASSQPQSEELEQVWERKAEIQQPAEVAATASADATTGAAAKVRSWRIPLVAGALVLLVAQVMYLQFDDWAVDPTFRPAYAAVCGLLPCDLPDRRDLNLLKSRALKVRSHPQQEDALLVDALIVNEAEFDQPFPVLHLKFTSVEGNRLASERFSPADYLAGEMTGVKMMPARTPVHIEVQAIDPGPNAVSYTLDFE